MQACCATSKSSLWNMEYVARGGAFECPRIYRTHVGIYPLAQCASTPTCQYIVQSNAAMRIIYIQFSDLIVVRWHGCKCSG